jgi:menaquinone-dependent protoporphyrinogen oxidase
MRVLVTAASKHGATAEIATWIAEGLVAAGLDVEVHDPDDVATLAGFDAVVLGSGVYAGRWLDPAKQLAERLTADLVRRPVWLFSSGPVGEPLKPEDDPVDAAPMRELTAARDHRVFPGRVERKRLGLGERAIVAALRVPDGDFRQREPARAWAREIAGSLAATPTRT